MQYIPIDVNTTQPQSGGMSVPEGFYLLQIKDATEVKPTQDGSKQFRKYKSEILMGPGWSQEYRGKPYTDSIMEGEQSWAPRHMELFVAAFGSVEAVRQVGAQYGGRLPAEVLAGRCYIVQLVKSESNGKTYTNVQQRIPYTQENWANSVGTQPSAPGGALAAQAQAIQAQAPAPAAPPAYAAPAPAAYAPPAAPPPPPAAPAFAPPAYAPPAVPTAFAPPALPGAGAMPGMPPLPPPPPGVPAGR